MTSSDASNLLTEGLQTVAFCARAIASPFFSVDIARRRDGVERIVEIGDGQVSDLVGWSIERIVEIWSEASHPR